jgi:hypothetical protein
MNDSLHNKKDKYISKGISVPADWKDVFSHFYWFDIIHACGYYDQSHLIHDFTHFRTVRKPPSG